MKLIRKEVNTNGVIILICKEDVILNLITRKRIFSSTENNNYGFRIWKNEQNNIINNESLLYQLDYWCNNEKYPFFSSLPTMEENIVYSALSCPLKKEIATCVFKELKDIKDLETRCDTIRKFNNKTKEDIYKTHKKCFIKRNKEMQNWNFFKNTQNNNKKLITNDSLNTTN